MDCRWRAGAVVAVLSMLWGLATPMAVADTPSRAALQAQSVAPQQVEEATIRPLGSFGGWMDAAAAAGGDHVYLGEGGALTVLDISDPRRPRQAAGVGLPGGGVSGITIDGTTGYVVDGDGLAVIDLATPAQPALLANLDVEGVARSVDVAGSYAYVAAAIDGTDGWLRVIDIANPSQPREVGRVDTPGSAAGVFVAGDTAWVADGDDLVSVDIAAPANPTLIASAPTRGTASDVYVAGSTAYVADGAKGLAVLDVSNRARPTRLATYDSGGFAGAVQVVGTAAYVADSGTGLHIVDVSQPAKPRKLAIIGRDWTASAVAVAGDRALVAGGANGAHVLDVAQPGAPIVLGVYDGPDESFDVFVADAAAPELLAGGAAGRKAYVAAPDSFWAFDLADPAAPQALGSTDVAGLGFGSHLDVAAGVAYLGSTGGALHLIDVSDAQNPALEGTYRPPGGSRVSDVKVAGSHAFVTSRQNSDGWLRVVDVSNPSRPSAAGSLNTPGDARRVHVAGATAYVADGGAGVRLVDVSDPKRPVERAHIDPPAAQAATDAVAAAGNRAYVASNAGTFPDVNGWLQMVDVSDPSAPVVLDTLSVKGPISDVDVTPGGRVAFVNFKEVVYLGTPAEKLEPMATYAVPEAVSVSLFELTDTAASATDWALRPAQGGGRLGMAVGALSRGTSIFDVVHSWLPHGPYDIASQEPAVNADSGAWGQLDPVYLHSGELHSTEIDLHVPGRGVSRYMDYQFMRTYRSRAVFRSTLGWGWQHNYDRYLLPDGANVYALTGPARVNLFKSDDGVTFTSPPGIYAVLKREPDGSYTLEERDGMVTAFHRFDGTTVAGKMTAITDRAGNQLAFAYDARGRLQTVTDTLGRQYTYRYDARGLLSRVEDFAGRRLVFTHDARGDLVAVTRPVVTGTPHGDDFPSGTTTRYTYSSGYRDPQLNHNLLTATAPNEVAVGGPPYLVNTYSTDPQSYDFDRVIRQEWGGY